MKQKSVAMALAAAVAALPGMAFEFEWDERDGAAIVTGCSGEVAGALAIPETLGGLPVRGIESGAFRGQADLTSVSVATNVTWIGMHAFAETKMFDNVTDAAQVPVYSTDGKWLLGCRLCSFTYTRNGETRKMHKPVSVNVKEGVEHLADGAFVGAEHRLQDDYTQLAAIDSVSLPSTLKTVGSAICNNDHLGLKVDFPTNVAVVANDFHACAAGVQFRFLGRRPDVVEGAGWLEAVDAEGFSPAPTAIYFRNGAEDWEDGECFEGDTRTWSRGCVEEETMTIRVGNVHCFGKYSDDVFLERASRAYPGEWVAIPVTGATKAAQLKPLLVPCGAAESSLVGAPAVWTDAKMFDTVVKPGLKKKWVAEPWADSGYGEVSYPGCWGYSDAKKDIDYCFPEDLWPNKKAVANRFWIVAKVNSSKTACYGPQIFRMGLSGMALYSEPFVANCLEKSPVGASDAFRGLPLTFSGTLFRNGQHLGSPGTVYDGAPHYSIEGKEPLTIKVSLPGPGTLVMAGGERDSLEKAELKISGTGIAQDQFSEEPGTGDEYAYKYGSSPYRRRVKVSGATTLTLKLPESDRFEFTRMRFFPSDTPSVAIDVGCYTPYTEVGVATRSAFARGSVKGAGVYRAGETVTLVAVAGAGEKFDSWECLYGTLPDEVDLSSPTLSFVVPDDACGTDDAERQIFVRAVWKPKASGTALPIPVGAAAVTDRDDSSVELTRTGKYRFVDDSDEATYRSYPIFDDAINQEQVSYVRLEVRPPVEDWLEIEIADTELNIGKAQSLAEVATEFVRVRSGSEATVTASGLPKGVVSDAKTGTLKGVLAQSGVHYITFTAKNANGYVDARVLRLVVGGAKERFQNGAKVYAETYYTSMPFDLPGLVVGEPIGTKTFYVQNTFLTKLKVKGLPPGLKAKVKSGNGSGCAFCGGIGSVTFSGTPSKVGAYTVTISGTYKNKTYKTVRTVVVQGSRPSLYIPVSVAADSLGRGTVSGGGVKAFGSTVKLTAKSANAKQYFFGGWYVGEGLEERLDDYLSCNSRAATVSFAVAAKRKVENDYGEGETVSFDDTAIRDISRYGIYARFVTKAEDPISIDAETEWRVTSGNPLTVNVQSFSSYTLSVNKTAITKASKKAKAAVSVSGNTLKVTNTSALKPGYHRLVLTAKNAAGNTCSFVVKAFVPNLTAAADLIGLDTSDEGYTLQVGKSVTLAALGISRKSGAKITAVSGLPTGMKWDAKKQRFTGLPTKGGTYTVVFAVKYSSCYGYSYTSRASATFTVMPLPDCAVGTFNGYTTSGDSGPNAVSRLVTVTTSSAGKITAKVGSLTFSKTGWDDFDGDGASVTLTATRTVGKGKTAKTYTDILNLSVENADWTDDGMSGTITTYLDGDVINADTDFTARKNVFALNDEAKAVANAVAGTRTFGWQTAEAESGYAYDLMSGTALTVAAKANGAVTLAGAIGKTKVSATTTLCPLSLDKASAVFFSGDFVIEVVYTLEEGAVVGVSGRVWKK